jgi:hypothetical protein
MRMGVMLRAGARSRLVAGALVGTIAVLRAAQPGPGRSPVRVNVIDETTGQASAARMYLRRGTEALVPTGLQSYSRGDERHFLIDGGLSLDLEPGTYALRVERGLEYVPVDVELAVPATAPVTIALRRWAAMNGDGWYSADMHVHRDPVDIPLILAAEDLNFVPTITTHMWSNDTSAPWKPPRSFPVVVAPNRFFTGNSQEIERIQGGPGAVILLGREMPLPFSGYELYPPVAVYAKAVHERGGLVEGDKPFWVDTFVNAALGHIDALEVNCNHFLPRLVDTDLAPWSHWPMEFGYRGARGFALWMMDLYYRILNSGIELPLSAGSANGVKQTPVGFNRLYVRPVSTGLDYASFMSALKQGRSFSTNGPVLELDVDGHEPGDRIALDPGREYRVRARARSRGTLERLQVIVNGRVAAERADKGDSREMTIERSLRFDRSSWIAVRVFERPTAREAWEQGPQIFAHTSPMYLLLDHKPVVVRESIQDVLQKIDLLIAHTQRLDGFKNESDRKETLDVYRAARQVLARRLE